MREERGIKGKEEETNGERNRGRKGETFEGKGEKNRRERARGIGE